MSRSDYRIKYNSQQNPDFIKELRKNVKAYFDNNHLSKYGNKSIVSKSVFMFLLYILPFILMFTGLFNSVIAYLICWIVMGIGMAGIGMVLMHDANHGTFSRNKRINKTMSNSLYLLGGFPPTWQFQHNTLHHGYTNIEGHDEDIAPIGLLRFSPHKPLKKIHKFQHWYAWFFYGLMTLSMVISKDFIQLFNYKKKELFRLNFRKRQKMLFTDLIVSKILYFTLFLAIPLAFTPIAWYWTVLFFIAMHYVSGFILSTIFQTAHVMPSSYYPLPDKNGNIENDWAIHQMMTTTNFAPESKIFSWMIGGLNYQVEHHLFPYISHVHYKSISDMVKNTAQKYNVPYHVQPSFLKAIINHYKMLKQLGQTA